MRLKLGLLFFVQAGILCFCLFASSTRAAESPQRFLQATQWIAQLSRAALDQGTSVQDDCTWTWSVTTSARVQIRMAKLPQGQGAPSWIGMETQTYSASGHEHFDSICPNGGNIVARGQPSSAKPTPDSALAIDVAAGTYTLTISTLSIPWDGTVTFGVNSIPQANMVTFWNGGVSGSITRPLPASGMILEGEEIWHLQDPPIIHVSTGATFPYVLGVGGGEVRYTWKLQPQLDPIELVVDIEDYDNYLPLGDLQDPAQAGNALQVTATIQSTNGTPTQTKATWIRFELIDVSKELGVCLNKPARAAANTDPDYKFENDQSLNPFPIIVMSDTTAETIPGQHTSAKAVISSFDFGGWCKLKVTAFVNGETLEGYLRSDTSRSEPQIRIPKRKDDSHIADVWLESEGVSNLSDDDDAENIPVGDDHRGDGLSLYEEYRGYSQNAAHLRTNAKKKDLLVLNTVGGVGAASCLRFQSMSKLKVHHEFVPDEFGSGGAGQENWINFNHTSHHQTDQHGLRIVQNSDANVGYAAAFNRPGFNGNSTPASKKEISVPKSLTSAAAADGAGSVARYAALSYAHELAHGCAIYHHGEVDPGRVLWIATALPESLEWRENGAIIQPRGELGQILPLPPLSTNGFHSLSGELAEQHGQHSGNGSCAMRYDIAETYVYPAGSSARYVTGGGELVGTILCPSATGTGVNAPSRQPRPRFGDAAAGRGNCAGQICVNDKYVSDAKHTR